MKNTKLFEYCSIFFSKRQQIEDLKFYEKCVFFLYKSSQDQKHIRSALMRNNKNWSPLIEVIIYNKNVKVNNMRHALHSFKHEPMSNNLHVCEVMLLLFNLSKALNVKKLQHFDRIV